MDILIYVLKTTALLSIFYLAYAAFLKNETFFVSNRKFLMGGIFAALVIPLLVLNRTIYREMPVFNFEIPQNTVQAPAPLSSNSVLEFWELGLSIYLTGVLIMLLVFLKRLWQVIRFLSSQNHTLLDGYKIVQVDGLESPFSFFNYIVIDQNVYTQKEFELIMKHEQTHAGQYHSLDMLLLHSMLVVNWFNPFAWLYKRAIIQNLEYLADAGAAGNTLNRKSYQLTLVKVAVPQMAPALTHSFYQSFIKKRIVMLNKQSSRKINKMKMALVLPVIAVFMWSFNYKEEVLFLEPAVDPMISKLPKSGENNTQATATSNSAISQNLIADKQVPKQVQSAAVETPNPKQKTPKPFKRVITTDFTESSFKALAEELKTSYDVLLSYSGLKYDASGNLTAIKISLKDKATGNNTSTSYSGDKPIQDILIYRNESGGFGVISGQNSIIQGAAARTKAEESQLQEDLSRRMEERREEMALRKAEVQEKMAERKAELESRRKVMKEEREVRMQEMQEEMEAKRAEMEELTVIGYGRSSANSRFKTPDSSYLRPKEQFLYGAPKDGFSIRMYGTAENSDKQPLFIKDGKEISREELNMIDPKDIESISILKDESSTALYKEKGKNGVILITTKVKKN